MLREVQDEPLVEVDKTDKGLDLLFIGRGRCKGDLKSVTRLVREFLNVIVVTI